MSRARNFDLDVAAISFWKLVKCGEEIDGEFGRRLVRGSVLMWARARIPFGRTSRNEKNRGGKGKILHSKEIQAWDRISPLQNIENEELARKLLQGKDLLSLHTAQPFFSGTVKLLILLGLRRRGANWCL